MIFGLIILFESVLGALVSLAISCLAIYVARNTKSPEFIVYERGFEFSSTGSSWVLHVPDLVDYNCRRRAAGRDGRVLIMTFEFLDKSGASYFYVASEAVSRSPLKEEIDVVVQFALEARS
ncbi:MAG: hypothetical protein ACI8W8_000962 [Rhodothermales bacterium]|jgi:hypothetical protein